MPPPASPKIYHIVHVDKVPSIIADGCLLSDAETTRRQKAGTTIGMNQIKERRLKQLTLSSHPSLKVGDCVPFTSAIDLLCCTCCGKVIILILHIEADRDQLCIWKQI
jgi:ssDNA thymidine ADP-ribosyltransferase, DarT